MRGFGAQCGDDSGPCLVELTGRGRCPAPAHPVRLGDAGDRDRGGEHRRADRQQVRRVHPAPGTMAENEQAARRTCGPVQGDQCRAERCGYLGLPLQEATRSTRSTIVRCFGISCSTMRLSAAGASSTFSARHATSIARRSRGVVAPHTP